MRPIGAAGARRTETGECPFVSTTNTWPSRSSSTSSSESRPRPFIITRLSATDNQCKISAYSLDPADLAIANPDASPLLLAPQRRSPRCSDIAVARPEATGFRKKLSCRLRTGHPWGPSSPHIPRNLDLLGMPTILFYESGYSIYVLRQASRRSWRIGQKHPVKVRFLAYAGTMQENCLRLMGKKLLVSLAMEGKFANQGLQALDDDDDILTAMARELVTEKGVGEKADALWREIQQQHTRLIGTTNVVTIAQPEPTQDGPCLPESDPPLCPPQSESAPGALVQLVLSEQRAARRRRHDNDAQLPAGVPTETQHKRLRGGVRREAPPRGQFARYDTHGEQGFLYQRPATVGRGHLPGGGHRKGTAAKEKWRIIPVGSLADRSGELDAKPGTTPNVAQLFACNDVVKVRGAMEQYNDKPQLIVSRIRRCEPQEYTASISIRRQPAIPRKCSAS